MTGVIDIAPHITDRHRERFARSHVVRPDGCWEWTGRANPRGYGQFGMKIDGVDKTVLAHRLSYEMHIGPIPGRKDLDHLCRNTSCVNPSHLDPCTPLENSLRGHSFAALNARVMCCPKGHPYDEVNTIIKPSRWGRTARNCRTCLNEYRRKSHEDPNGVPCDLCGRKFSTVQGMKRHKAWMHTEGVQS